jgi:hypothetical protein
LPSQVCRGGGAAHPLHAKRPHMQLIPHTRSSTPFLAHTFRMGLTSGPEEAVYSWQYFTRSVARVVIFYLVAPAHWLCLWCLPLPRSQLGPALQSAGVEALSARIHVLNAPAASSTGCCASPLHSLPPHLSAPSRIFSTDLVTSLSTSSTTHCSHDRGPLRMPSSYISSHSGLPLACGAQERNRPAGCLRR